MKEALKLALEALEDTLSGDLTPYQAAKTISAIKEALAQPEPPPECKTEEEKTAFAFGWFKAMESHRVAQQSNEQVEPFGWGRIDLGAKMFYDDKPMLSDGKTFPLYTHPPVPDAKLTAQPKEQKQRPFTKKQRDTLCTVYAIASASTTANSLPNIAKIVNQLLTEDLEVQPKEPEHSAPHGEPVIRWVCKGCRYEYMEAPSSCDCMESREYERVEYFTTPPQRPSRSDIKPLTVDQVWENDQLMSLNAELGCGLYLLMEVVEAIEAAHGIKE